MFYVLMSFWSGIRFVRAGFLFAGNLCGAVFLQVHVLVADALAEVFFVQLFLEQEEITQVERNPTQECLLITGSVRASDTRTSYLFGFHDLLNVLQLLLQLPFLLA